jgi:multidrug resistance efflux pump
MFAAILITVVFIFVLWLIFGKLKLLKFNVGWGIISTFFLAHILLTFLVGMRFQAPYSTDLRVVQHTIQIVPRLEQPALVTEVLVEPNEPVKKGQPLFRFDRRPYEYAVQEAEAALAAAKQNVLVLKADLDAAVPGVARAHAELKLAREQYERFTVLAPSGAVSTEDIERHADQLASAEAAVDHAEAVEHRARLAYESQINGVNTAVAEAEAQLAQAKYYLDHTIIVAPADGYITNLQVQPGMVAGIVRFGAIASFIVDQGRYLLATYPQEWLKFVEPGQPVEIALDLYPGQIFEGKVENIWWASGEGQFLPSGTLPTFAEPEPPARFPVKITMPDADDLRLPIGAHGAAAIYAWPGGFTYLRRIVIRTYTWLNWLQPLPF